MRKMLLAGVAGLVLVAAPTAISQSVFSKPGALGEGILTMDNSRGVLTMAPLLERVSPAVVSIRTEASEEEEEDRELSREEEMFERFFGRQLPRRGGRNNGGSVGSGVIVDASKGLILTNNHVVDDSGEIIVVLQDRRELRAELIGGDEKTDIAVLKVKAGNLKDVRFARDDSSKVGDYVIAIGNPFGLGHTVTTGIVSAKGREISGGDRYQDFIQTDASINPGNSGGALVNSRGELIGINSAIISRSGGNNGIGFAVPVKIARSVMNQLVSYGEVRRGRIGVIIRDITPDLKESMGLSTLNGALVNDVTAGSPAEKAGLESGDIIIGFNGEAIRDASDIRNAVGLVEPGRRADLTYIRNGRERTTRILVETPPEDGTEAADGGELAGGEVSGRRPDVQQFSGARLTDIPKDVELRGGDKGVYVSAVERGSRAARAGLRRGDVIRKVGRNSVRNLDEFVDLTEDRNGPVAVSVERNGTNLFLAIR